MFLLFERLVGDFSIPSQQSFKFIIEKIAHSNGFTNISIQPSVFCVTHIRLPLLFLSILTNESSYRRCFTWIFRALCHSKLEYSIIMDLGFWIRTPYPFSRILTIKNSQWKRDSLNILPWGARAGTYRCWLLKLERLLVEKPTRGAEDALCRRPWPLKVYRCKQNKI